MILLYFASTDIVDTLREDMEFSHRKRLQELRTCLAPKIECAEADTPPLFGLPLLPLRNGNRTRCESLLSETPLPVLSFPSPSSRARFSRAFLGLPSWDSSEAKSKGDDVSEGYLSPSGLGDSRPG